MALIDTILWQLERHISAPLSTETLAELCAISPYHMNRAFRAGTGLAPMGYLRARRLARAAQALAQGNEDILSIALEAQYGSHEAFTRAFVAAYGLPPRALRTARSLDTLTLQEPLIMSKDQLLDLAPPTIEDRPEMTLAGLTMPCSQDEVARIPALWERFNAVCGDPALDLSATYGVCFNATHDGAFDYLAGAGLAGCDVPADMVKLTVPAGRYAVFEHKGHVSDMPRMFYTIWNKALGAAGLTPRNAPEYEIYDRRFDPRTGRGTLVVAIPVE